MTGYEIRPMPLKGRGLFATRDFKKGETVLQDLPLVSSQFSWNAAYKYLACEYCMKPLETAEENVRRLTGQTWLKLPHPECCSVQRTQQLQVKCPNCPQRYCTVECFNGAMERYHKILCLGNDFDDEKHPINALNEAWKKMHYPPETTTIMLIVKLVAMYRQTDQKKELLDAIQDFHHEFSNADLMIHHKMLDENYQRDLNNLYELYTKAFDFSGMEVFLDIEIFKRIFVLIGQNGQGIGTSSFADWVKNVSTLDLSADDKCALDKWIDECYANLEEVTGLNFLNNEGSALYTLQSKANHSCVPNVQATFPSSNHVLHLVALKNIAAGEEICTSYLNECMLMCSRHTRQKELKENYLFVCTCSRCEEQKNDPDVTSDEDVEDEEDEDEDDAERMDE